MATKAELESARDRHAVHAANALAASKSSEPTRAIDESLASLPFVPNFVAWNRKYGSGTDAAVRLPTIDIITSTAPALFEWRALERLGAFAAAEARLFKRLGRDLAGEVRAARGQLSLASALWDRLAALGDGAPLPEWSARKAPPEEKAAVKVWRELGVVIDTTTGVRLTGSLGDAAVGICSSCGVRRRGEARDFLTAGHCPKCHARTPFVLTPVNVP